MSKLSRILLPSILGVLTSIIANKLLPKDLSPNNPLTDLRGGDDKIVVIVTKTISEKFLENAPLKLALIIVFTTAIFSGFNEEIQKLLSAEVFKVLSTKEIKGNLKIVCDIVKDYDLDLHSQSMSEFIVATKLSNSDKINLLKIKLNFVINDNFVGRNTFIIKTVLAIIFAIIISGSGILSIGLFLEAL